MKSIVKFMGFVSVLALAVSCSQPSIDDEDVLSYGSETTATSEATDTNPTNGGGQTSTDVEEGNHGTTTTEHQPCYEMDCDLNGETNVAQYEMYINGVKITNYCWENENDEYMLMNSNQSIRLRLSITTNGKLHVSVQENRRNNYEIQNVIKNGDSIYITTAQLR